MPRPRGARRRAPRRISRAAGRPPPKAAAGRTRASNEFTLNLAFTGEEEGFYQPAWVEITPPNETKALKIEWPWETDSLVDQRSATHPGTFVNPIG
ncbi:hypothetical protein [Streptomyces javensis]|uniref:hypothetical protein n=1 Tax=Streptomyces javensis TaxID=114698 RepID=UPI001FEBB538|nr:hypothetical protein [Streptomyces javensis]